MTILWCAEFLGDYDFPYPSSGGTIAYNIISRLLDKKINVAVADPLAGRHRSFITQSGKALGRLYATYQHRDVLDLVSRIRPEKIVTDELSVASALLSVPDIPEIVLIARTPEIPMMESLSYNVVAVSKAMQDDLNERDIVSTYIPLGVDHDTFGKIEKPKKGFVFGCSCRNKPAKNFFRLMEAFSIFNDAYKDVAALAIHTDNGTWDMRGMAKKLGIQKSVFFAQWPVNQEALNRIYNSFDVHINIGGNEWSALPVLESMASGVPQIAGDYGVLREYTEECGILVPVTKEIIPSVGHVYVPDTDKMFNAMEKLWMNEIKRTEAGIAAISTAGRYSWDDSAELWEGLLSGTDL